MKPPAHSAPFVFEGVHKSFGSIRALLPTSLTVEPGEFLTLLGPSGSGKTTLLNIAAGYLAPDGGRVRIGDVDLTPLPPRRRNIGMVFQNYALFPHLDVRENVAYGLRVRRRPAREVDERVSAALTMVRLDGFERRAIHELSGGQQQRVALARAMVIEPHLLLMDEPLGALDRQLRKHVQLEIRRLHRNSRRTTIYVTHDQEEALVMSDRIAVMNQGRIEQIGSPAELYRSPENAFVAAFLGESNLIPVTIHERTADEIAFRFCGMEPTWRVPARPAGPPGSAALLLVRPEDLRLAEPDEPALDGEVGEVVYLGEISSIRVTLAGGQDVWLRQMKQPSVRIGERVRIRWDPASVRLLEPIKEPDKQGGSTSC